MKYLLPVLVLMLLVCVQPLKGEEKSAVPEQPESRYIDVTSVLPSAEFGKIKKFILEKGGTMTYCNMYNDNPYYRFGNFDVFLSPSVGQFNINCDPRRSDFNQMTIRTEGMMYLNLHYATDYDSVAQKDISLYGPMQKSRVYLIDYYYGGRLSEETLTAVLQSALQEIGKAVR